jgi:ubiquinone/menaquinone biosynthesis C-methylase UbiE
MPLLHPRLRNSARNLVLLSGPDLRQWLYDLGQRLDNIGQRLEDRAAELGQRLEGHAAERRSDIAALRTEIAELHQRLDDIALRTSGLGSHLRGDYYRRSSPPTVTEYWTRHNVTAHHEFTSVEDSLRQLSFRNQQYPCYIELMPVSGKDDSAILDFGCGPGHDLVGFAHYSRPKRLVGIDVSETSLAEAQRRLALHEAEAELVRIEHGTYDLPFEERSFDYIHCSGVLMCIEDPPRLLREFYRLLKPGGELRLMVYNCDSIWLHLYVAFIVQIENGLYADVPPRVAFLRTTDGEDCPTNAVWQPEECLSLGRSAGFEPEFLGAAVSLWELHILPRRHLACLHPALPDESRAFLMNLRIDPQGHPMHGDHRAGIDACYRFCRPA